MSASANTSRQRQLRLEKKRRRRAQRRRSVGEVAGGPLRAEVVWAERLVVAPEGQVGNPRALARFDALGLMSDALMKLVDPYVYWPPAPGELPLLRAWLELGARVWNAVLRASPGALLDEVLGPIEADWELLEEPEPMALKRELAERKQRVLGHDFRLVSHVRVWEEGKMAMVEAGTISYLR